MRANGENAVDPFRNQVTETLVTSITLDAFGRAVRQVRATSQAADARETLQTYDAGGQSHQHHRRRGQRQVALLRLCRPRDQGNAGDQCRPRSIGNQHQGLERRYAYDALGQLTDTLDVYLDGTDLLQSGQSVVYNAFGEVVEEQRKWGLASQSLGGAEYRHRGVV